MWNLIWPIAIVVASNTFYNICTKSTPEGVDSFATLTITYAVAMVCSLVMFFLTSGGKNLAVELGKANWTAYILGVVVVGLEFGYICIYRAGWKISSASLVANITLACVLLLIGLLLYKESLTLRQVLGMIVCLAGLVLIAK